MTADQQTPLTGTVQTGRERAEQREQDAREYSESERARAENSNRVPGLG